MGVAVFALPLALTLTTEEEILRQAATFNTIWFIGLFFFGVHLILLANILKRPKWIAAFLAVAGVMYILDTSAHFIIADYGAYAGIFLVLVALPSVIGEMALAIWLLIKGGKK